MVKLTFCLRRRPEMSLEAFQDYWLNRHAPLVRKLAGDLRIRRYTQTHRTDRELNEAFRASRSAMEAYDGIAELWWDSLEDLQAAMETPEGQSASLQLLEDEMKFIDLEKSSLWMNQEHPIIA